jgi:hypothetical protein
MLACGGIVGFSSTWRLEPGKLRLLSPEEAIHALILRIAEAINATRPVEEMQIWLDCLLNVSFEFVAVDSEEAFFWSAMNTREAIGAMFDGHFRTPVQRCYEVAAFRETRQLAVGGKVSVADIVTEWQTKFRSSNMSERIDREYIDVCLVIYDRLLTIPVVRDEILGADETLGRKTPFDSIYKLEAVARRAMPKRGSAAVAVDKAYFLVKGLCDYVQNGDYSGAELSVRALSGKGHGGRGLCDLLLYKQDLLRYLLHEWVEKLDLDVDVKVLLRQVMESHSTYRIHFGFRGGVPVDMSWLVTMSPAEKSVFRLVEACSAPRSAFRSA